MGFCPYSTKEDKTCEDKGCLMGCSNNKHSHCTGECCTGKNATLAVQDVVLGVNPDAL